MKFLLRFILTVGLLTFSVTAAEAHAFLDHSEPRVGSTIPATPPVVKIWFTMAVQGALSNIAVFDANGHEVDDKDAKVDPADPALMAVSVPKLPAGSYKVRWNAVCPWGHHTSGSFAFTIAAPK